MCCSKIVLSEPTAIKTSPASESRGGEDYLLTGSVRAAVQKFRLGWGRTQDFKNVEGAKRIAQNFANVQGGRTSPRGKRGESFSPPLPINAPLFVTRLGQGCRFC